jgi:hypothetical protein
MDHYVAYQKPSWEDEGGLSIDSLSKMKVGSRVNFLTRKKLVLNRVGDRAWFVYGVRAKGMKTTKYYLAGTFIIDDVLNVGEGWFRFEGDFDFKPVKPIVLSGVRWFADFLHSQNKFSLGLNKIQQVYVKELLKLKGASN